jgi:hypothetical protein
MQPYENRVVLVAEDDDKDMLPLEHAFRRAPCRWE